MQAKGKKVIRKNTEVKAGSYKFLMKYTNFFTIFFIPIFVKITNLVNLTYCNILTF